MAETLRIGDYEVLAQLQSGGMATLYLAQRSGPAGFRKQVAIKVLKSHLASNKKFIEMFIDEARIAARIAHPNVVHIEELGETEGQYFLVMEYLHGAAISEILMSLAKLERRLTPAMSVAIALGAASGLHAAHETRDDNGHALEVIHRDVSPQNILVGARGEVKVIDFGIAKARGRLHVTEAGAGLKGKLRYMAPEQLQGTTIDRRADIYGLAVVVWEMLAMRRLFQGQSDPEVIQRIIKGQMPPPGAFADLPFALDGVVLHALSSDPNLRPSTAREFRKQLKDAVPEAGLIDQSDVAALLWAIMSASLTERAEKLPGVGAMLLNIERDLTSEEALERFTQPLGEVVHDSTVVAMGIGADAEDAATEVSADGISSLDVPIVPQAVRNTSQTTSGAEPMKLVLIVVMAIVIGALAAVLAISAMGTEPEPTPVEVIVSPSQ